MSATTAATQEISSSVNILSATSIFYFLLVPAVVVWYAYWKISRKHLVDLAEKIPGPRGFPILGSALEFIGSSHGKKYTKPNIIENCRTITNKFLQKPNSILKVAQMKLLKLVIII